MLDFLGAVWLELPICCWRRKNSIILGRVMQAVNSLRYELPFIEAAKGNVYQDR